MQAADEPSSGHLPFDLSRADWFDLRDSLLTAEAVAQAARNRTESRRAHWRADSPAVDPAFERNQTIVRTKGGLADGWQQVSGP